MPDVICYLSGALLLLLGVWIILLDWYVLIALRFTKSERWKSFPSLHSQEESLAAPLSGFSLLPVK